MSRNRTCSEPLLVGHVTLDEPLNHRISYETASWYTEVELPAGTYPVYFTEGSDYGRPFRGVWFKIVGTVTASSFTNRVFTASSTHIDRDVGDLREINHTVASFDYPKWVVGHYGARHDTMEEAVAGWAQKGMTFKGVK